MRLSIRGWVSVGGCALFIFLLWAGFRLVGMQRFDLYTWKAAKDVNAYPGYRLAVVDEVMHTQLRRGMTSQQVLELLGLPMYQSSTEIGYGLGIASAFPFAEARVLRIRLDEAGMSKRASSFPWTWTKRLFENAGWPGIALDAWVMPE